MSRRIAFVLRSRHLVKMLIQVLLQNLRLQVERLAIASAPWQGKYAAPCGNPGQYPSDPFPVFNS